MRVLVLGATGYVGSRLVPHLLDLGHEVVAASSSPPDPDRFGWDERVEAVRCDVTDAASVARALAGVDAVVYLVHSLQRSDFTDRDRLGAETVAAAVDEQGVRRLVYLSGLVPDAPESELSAHISSRLEVERILLGTQAEFSFMSPVLHLMETALEPIDPMVSMPRLARWPLEGHPVRPIYEPVGLDDSYFPPGIYDAMVLAYGHPRAGDEVWTSMHEAQSLMGLGDVVSYPVKQNLKSENGTPYTGVVVQYRSDGTFDSHGIFRRLEQVRHQYGCFHDTFQKTGIGVVPPPGLETDPCAQ